MTDYNKMPEKNLTVKMVAEIFSKCPETIIRWINAGVFKGAFKVRDGYLIPEKEVLRVKNQFKIG